MPDATHVDRQPKLQFSPLPTEVSYPHIVKPKGGIARLEDHPRTPETHAALTYYFDHREEIEEEVVIEYPDVAEWKKSHPTPPLLVQLKQQVPR